MNRFYKRTIRKYKGDYEQDWVVLPGNLPWLDTTAGQYLRQGRANRVLDILWSVFMNIITTLFGFGFTAAILLSPGAPGDNVFESLGVLIFLAVLGLWGLMSFLPGLIWMIRSYRRD